MLAVRRNLKLIPWFNFFIDFRFINVLFILFYAEVTGSYALAMSICTITLIATSLFEVPTGILSDKYLGRARTMSAGVLMDIVSFIFYGFAGIYSSYWLLACGGLFQGIAFSFYSGTDHALLYESLKQLRKQSKYHEVYGRVNSMLQISAATAALFGGFLAYATSYTFVVWLSLIPLSISFIISMFYVEPKHITSEDHDANPYKHLKEAIQVFFKNKKLRKLAAIDIVDTAFGNVGHRFQIVFFQTLVPIWVIGIIRSIKQFGGAVSFWFAGSVINKFGVFKTLIGGSLIMNGIKLIALGLNNIFSPFFYCLINLGYGSSCTAQNKLMQDEFTDKQRATMGSIVSFFGNMLFGILSIAVGFLADNISAVNVLYILMIPEVFIISIYWKMMKSEKGR